MDSKGPLYAAGASADMTRSTDDDSLVDGPLISPDVLHSAIRREFQTLPTSTHAILLSILHVLYVVLSVCVAVLCVLKFGRQEDCMTVLGPVSGDSAIVFGKVGLWVLVMLFNKCVHHHHDQARARGYLRFFRLMAGLIHLPLNIHSTGNLVILVILAAQLSPPVNTFLLLSVIILELLVALPCLLYYAVKVIRFNKDRAAPDISQEEHLWSYSVTSLPTETGFRDGSSLEEVVEKQADLIEYLKQHNSILSRRLLNLTAQH